MDFAYLLSHYGYLALFIGTLLEGETILILAGVAAQQEYLSYPAVVLVAFLGGSIGDQTFFFIGRHYGASLLDRFPRWKWKARQIHRMMKRYNAAIILLIHFMYGLRTVGPAVLGTGKIPAWKFAVYNLMSVAIWAVVVGGLGMLFGGTVELIMAKAKQCQLLLLAGVVLIIAGVAIYRWRRARKRNASSRTRRIDKIANRVE